MRFAGASVRAVGTAAEASTEIASLPRGSSRSGSACPTRTESTLARRIWHDRHGAPPPSASCLHVFVARHGRQECRQLRHHRVCLPAGQAGAADSGGAPGRGPGTSRPRRQRAGRGDERRPRPRRRRPRILLVEDNRDNWVRAMRIRSGNGYEVDRAEDGLEAVSAASAHDYDLVLMDVELPQIDGIEATRRIRAHEADVGRRVPIVALTAHAIESLRQEALAAGMNDYATKPFEKQQLLDVCAKWIDRRPLAARRRRHARPSAAGRHLSARQRLSSRLGRQRKGGGRCCRTPLAVLVLLDMNMPVMDGYEAARSIRRLPVGETVPIVALTSHEGPQERERCLAAGCSDFLSKPVRRDDLWRI